MADVSFLIPARNEIYLEKTILNILQNIRGNSEILVYLDGWIPNPQIVINDDRVKFFYPGEQAVGHRAATNHLARHAQGKYICKIDAHCAIGEGFDKIMMADCEYDWTVIPSMYNLDVKTWKPKHLDNFDRAVRTGKLNQYLYIGINEKDELRTLYYQNPIKNKIHHDRKDSLIDETMSCMGPCFFMHKDRFWELGGCDEGHEGGWGQQAVEVACKAWLSGGKLMVNKKTWFAHWFRAGDGGFPYPISGSQISRVRAYSKDLWLNDKWPGQKRPFKWLIEKFDPPGWSKPSETIQPLKDPQTNADQLNNLFYKHIHLRKVDCSWKGVRLIKMPSDVMLYHKVIWENKPDFIIDSGTKFGGSSLFYQDMLDMVGRGGKVITIDKFPVAKTKDPRITYIEDGSTSEATLKYIRETVKDKSVMVVLDSDHSRQHVKRELYYYSHIVTSGQYLVIEDCYTYKSGEAELAGPGEARDWFLKRSKKLKQTDLDNAYIVGFCRGGWLRKDG